MSLWIFLHKKVKVKKLLFKFFWFFVFLSLLVNVLLLSLAMSTAEQFRWLACFLRRLYISFLRKALCSAWKKIQVQIIAFNKKAIVKISRISNSKSPLRNIEYQVFLGRYLKNSLLIFFSCDCELIVHHKNIWLLQQRTFAHLLNLFKTRCVFIIRNSLFADWTKGITYQWKYDA